MKKTISVYGPLAIVLLLAGAAWLHICDGAASRPAQTPLAPDQFTAELARATSYGMIDDASVPRTAPTRAATPLPLAQAS